MRSGLHYRTLHSYFEDPCLYVRLPRERRAILFDIGDLTGLGPADIYKITDVFVTHTHIDHFIGFDTLLRIVLKRDLPLNIYGPSNIVSCVAGKLRGYAWNLITEYPTVINVYSFTGKKIRHYVFRAAGKFKKEFLSDRPSDGTLLQDPLFRVRAAKMDHGIACLAYTLEEEFHINIDKEMLGMHGLSVGPWLNEFKRSFRKDPSGEKKIDIEGRKYPVSSLSDIARITTGQKISYATDIAMTAANIARLINLIKGSDVFFCEAYFLEKDRQRALERYHLTAKTCGEVARAAGVKRLELIHVSPKYKDHPQMVIDEAMSPFEKDVSDH